MSTRLPPIGLFTLLTSGMRLAPEPDLTPDPSGATQIQVPQGWKVESRQEGGAYLWLTSASDQPDTPGVVLYKSPPR